MFAALTFTGIYMPGRLAIRALGLRSGRRLDRFTLALAVGMPLAAAAYAACVAAGAPWLFRLWPVVAAGASCLPRLRPGTQFVGGLRYVHSLLLVVVACALARLAAASVLLRNLARTSDGGLTLHPLGDLIFHVAIANELTHHVPPSNPAIPGLALNYHYGMDLLAALFTPFGLDTMDLTVRFVPVLLLVFLVLAAFCCARAWPIPETAAVVVPWLMVLGEDFSFIPGLLVGSPEPWVVWFLGMPSTASLYLLNPMLPALGFLMAALLAAIRFFEDEGRAWLVILALTTAALFQTKVFVGAQWLCALGAASLVQAFRRRRLAPLLAPAAAAAAAAPLLVSAWGADAGRNRIALDPWPYVPTLPYRMGLGDTVVARWTGEFYNGQTTLARGLVFFGIGLSLYLFLSYGARLAGLPRWWRAFARPLQAAPAHYLAAVFIALGPLLSLSLSVTAAGYPARTTYNNAVWFLIASKHAGWLYAVEAMASWKRRGAAVLGVAGLVVLSLPATLELLARTSAAPGRLSPSLVRMLEFARREVPAGSVCLAREDLAQVLLATTPCRALVLDVFPYSFLSPSEQAALRGRRDSFWAAWSPPAAEAGAPRVRFDVLEELGVDYVIVRAARHRAPAVLSEGRWRLEPRYTDGFDVFRVARAD